MRTMAVEKKNNILFEKVQLLEKIAPSLSVKNLIDNKKIKLLI